eukprot:5563721-Amphidinium_carterae.1
MPHSVEEHALGCFRRRIVAQYTPPTVTAVQKRQKTRFPNLKKVFVWKELLQSQHKSYNLKP